MQLHEYSKPKTRKQRKTKTLSKYNLSYKDLAKAFGYSNANSFNSSKALPQMIKGIEWVIKQVEGQLKPPISN